MITEESTETNAIVGPVFHTFSIPAADGRYNLNIPTGASVMGVCADMDADGRATIMTMVNPNAQTEEREFVVISPGQQAPPLTLAYVGYFCGKHCIKGVYEIVD